MRKDFPELEQKQSPCKILKKMSKFWTGSKPEHLLFFVFLLLWVEKARTSFMFMFSLL